MGSCFRSLLYLVRARVSLYFYQQVMVRKTKIPEVSTEKRIKEIISIFPFQVVMILQKLFEEL